MFTTKESKHILIITLVVAIVFAFDDKQPVFILSSWLRNFIVIFFGAALTVIVHAAAHKIAAGYYSVKIEITSWNLRRFTFATKAYLRRGLIPLGAIISLIFTIFSNGRLYFPLSESFNITDTERHKRIGKRFQAMTDYETARLAFFGPLANILLAFFIKLLDVSDTLVLMNVIFASVHMLPLPQVDGSKIFFGSKLLFAFGITFIFLSALFLIIISNPFIILFTLLIAAAVSLFYLYKLSLKG